MSDNFIFYPSGQGQEPVKPQQGSPAIFLSGWLFFVDRFLSSG